MNNKKVVLVVEDEPSMLSIIKDKIEASGIKVIQAKDGEEGLKLALENHPDLILLDILLPKIDGLTVMDKLRQDSWGNSVPIIALTNVSADSDKIIKTIVRDQPAYYFVKSDVKLDQITDKVKEILKID